MENEKRKPPERFKVTVFIGTGEEFEPFGKTRDISSSGMYIETKLRPEIGSKHQISFVWGEDSYFCSAEIVRHAEDGVGITYLDADTSFKYAIEELTNLGED